jgi:hypothetical protein
MNRPQGYFGAPREMGEGTDCLPRGLVSQCPLFVAINVARQTVIADDGSAIAALHVRSLCLGTYSSSISVRSIVPSFQIRA